MLAERLYVPRVPFRVLRRRAIKRFERAYLLALREELRPQLVERVRAFYGHRLGTAQAERVADELFQLALKEADPALALRTG